MKMEFLRVEVFKQMDALGGGRRGKTAVGDLYAFKVANASARLAGDRPVSRGCTGVCSSHVPRNPRGDESMAL